MHHTVYRRLPDEDYRSIDAVSQSGLKLVLRSPRHYWHEYVRPGAERKTTKAKDFGSALHMAIFEPHRIDVEVAVMPEDAPPDRRSKANREWHEEYERLNAGKIILSSKDKQRLDDCAGEARSLAEVQELLADGEPELSLHWTDPGLMVDQKARIDFAHRDFKFLVDLKSTEDASQDAFSRSIWSYRYDFQGAAYLEAVFQCVDILPRAFFIIAAETQPPFGAKVYRLDEATIARGKHDYERALATYAQCRHSGLSKQCWPAYESGISPISIPPWALRLPIIK